MSWYTKQELKPFRNAWVESFQDYINENVGKQWDDVALVIIGFIVLIAIVVVLDFLIKRALLFFTRKIVSATKFTWDNHFYDSKVFNSVFHLFPLSIARSLAPYILYPTPTALTQMGKIFDIIFVLVFLQLFFRLANAILSISTDENNYRTIAVRTFGQLMKIITTFFVALIIVSIIFNVKLETIITGLGAATAILLLIFRDTILGFVSGVQISSTRMVKVGDWIGVNKYNVEGVVKEINLVSCKIENFDKTISSLPTYELIATEVRNYEAMTQTRTRRIKRSIVFNVKSFQFCTEEMLEKYSEIDLIKNYINRRRGELAEYNSKHVSNPNLLANGKRLTNIGVFRKYAVSYLQENPNISKRDSLMVRQLEITPHGMPLEIYCFAKTAVWIEFEAVQADVFDHLVTASKEFDLEVVQTLPVK
ncbi:mechanosensitive ion channel [Flavobacteriaceae bacterium Ap0902]|nr:mechanosensitive ion channel [Flavobacteriaceae bacterium Ap0902]